MDLKLFWTVLATGIALVVVQGVAAFYDEGGYLTQKQMNTHRVTNGYSFMEHGGMWADVFIVSPLVAYVMSKYQLKYFSGQSLTVAAAAIILALVLGYVYQNAAIARPEAHTHDGVTTIAGWIHGLYAVAVIWVGAQVYFDLTSPPISKEDVIGISILLTPFFYLGAAKFNERWTFDAMAKWQVAAGITFIWVCAAIRIWRA